MGHRRWLHGNRKFRTDYKLFDGTIELEDRPYCLSGVEVLQQLELEKVENKFGKESENELKKRKSERQVR